ARRSSWAGAVPSQWQRMITSCRPMAGHHGVHQSRRAMFWPADALVLAERLLVAGTGAVAHETPTADTKREEPPAPTATVPVWDGITHPETLTEDALRVRMELADAAKKYDWRQVLRMLDDNPRADQRDATRRHFQVHGAAPSAHGEAPAGVVRSRRSRRLAHRAQRLESASNRFRRRTPRHQAHRIPDASI